MVLVPPAVIADDLIRFTLSADAHRCCASTGGECAQLSTPDDCCQTQEQAASQGYTSVAPDARRAAPDLIVAVVVPSSVTTIPGPVADDRPISGAIKRPHDPPHLHTFPLLI
jgi:hypothetical protein